MRHHQVDARPRTGRASDVNLLHYEGKNAKMLCDVSDEDARWLGGHLSKLSDEQIADAFRAANYTADEVKILTAAVRARIGELVSLK